MICIFSAKMKIIYQMSYYSGTKIIVNARDWNTANMSIGTLYKPRSGNLQLGRIYSDRKTLYLKTPFMYCPFGANKPYRPCGEPQERPDIPWTLQMVFGENNEHIEFLQKTKEFDQWFIDEASKIDNCAKWLKASRAKPYSRDVIDTKYTHMLKYKRNRDDDEASSQFPPFISVRLPITPMEPYHLACEMYQTRKKLAPVTIDKIPQVIPRGCWCSATLIGTLWCSCAGFGVVWYVKQLVVYPDYELIPSVWKPIEEDDEEPVKKCLQITVDDDDIEPMNKVTTVVIPQKTEHPNDLFNLKCNGPHTLFIAPNKYSIGEKTTVSRYDLYSRFYREVNGCFDGFDWDHICIAGGLLTGLVEKKYDPAVYAESDIDVFIYGVTEDDVKQRFAKTLKFFQAKFADLWIVPLPWENIMVVNLCTECVRRSIQLIGVTNISDPMQLIQRFDLSHCQIAFDGNEFICTTEFSATMSNRQAQILGKKTTTYRLYKAYMRGFSVMIPNHPVCVKDCSTPHEKQTKLVFSYGIKDSTAVVDNLREFTLDKLLSEKNIMSFSQMSFNPKNKERYIKDGTAILSGKIDDWVTDYLKTHTPCPY